MFGGAIHKAIEHHFNALFEGSDPPSLDTLVDVYNEAWTSETGVSVRYGKGESEKSLRDLRAEPGGKTIEIGLRPLFPRSTGLQSHMNGEFWQQFFEPRFGRPGLLTNQAVVLPLLQDLLGDAVIRRLRGPLPPLTGDVVNNVPIPAVSWSSQVCHDHSPGTVPSSEAPQCDHGVHADHQIVAESWQFGTIWRTKKGPALTQAPVGKRLAGAGLEPATSGL